MTLDSDTNKVRVPATLAGMRIMRGNTRGTLTMAISFSRPKASRPPRRTMKFSDLLATWGKGWDGSRPTGISNGRTSRSKYCLTQRRWAGLRSPWDTILIPSRSKAGISFSL